MKTIEAFMIAAVLLMGGQAAFAQGNEADAFRELALRSLTYPGAPPDDLQLLPGALPEGFPIPLTYPDSTHLIGTVKRTHETTVFITSDLSAADVMRYYYEHFQRTGWRTQEWPRWGFASAAEAYPNMYCQVNGSVWFNIMAQEVQGSETDIRISLNRGEGRTPCSEEQMIERVGDIPPMPFIPMPSGVELTSVGSGGGQTGEFQTSATMRTTQSPENLMRYFETQLTRGEWQQVDAGADATTHWRTYRITDRQGRSWSGQFFLTKLPGQDRLTAHVLATRADEQSGSNASPFRGGSGRGLF